MPSNPLPITLVSIDPGASGMCCIWHPGQDIEFQKPPYAPENIRAILSAVRDASKQVIVGLELVGTPHLGLNEQDMLLPDDVQAKAAKSSLNRVGATLKLRDEFARWHQSCLCMKLPVVTVAPQSWMNAVVPKAERPKGNTDDARRRRKNAIKDAVQRLYPDHKVTLQKADALGILHYMKQNPGRLGR